MTSVDYPDVEPTAEASNAPTIDELRAERDGYKSAYEAVSTQLVEMRSMLEQVTDDLDGYKLAYEIATARLEPMRADADGYRRAYSATAEEAGVLRGLVDQYRTLYETVCKEHVEAASLNLPDYVSHVSPDVQSFLVLGNGRTGSTWLITNADRLPDVVSQREIKWRVPGFLTNRIQVLVDVTTRSLVDAIAEANSLIGTPNSGTIRISGSKLIYDPYGFLAPEVFDHIGKIVEPKVKLISLRRRYLEWFLSWKARGVFHEVNEDVYASFTDTTTLQRELEHLRANPRPPVRNIVLTHHGFPLVDPSTRDDPILYALVDAVDDLLLAFWHDLQSIKLVRQRSGLIIDYSEIKERTSEFAAYIGSNASPEIVRDIAERPLTKRLELLPASLVQPERVLVEIGSILDEAIARVADGKDDPDQLWIWRARNCVAIDLPALKETLAGFDVDVTGASFGVSPSPDDERLIWVVRKPIYNL